MKAATSLKHKMESRTLSELTESMLTQLYNGLKNIIQSLDNRVQTMNNDLIRIDTLLSHVEGVKPNVDRIAANEGKEDARKD